MHRVSQIFGDNKIIFIFTRMVPVELNICNFTILVDQINSQVESLLQINLPINPGFK